MANPSSSCSSNSRNKTREFFCSHCNQTLSRSSYYLDRRFYFNSRTKEWSKTRVNFGESEPDSDAECFMPASSTSELQNDFDFSSDGSFKGKNVLLNVQLPCRLVHCDCSPFVFYYPHIQTIHITLRFHRSSYSSDIIMFCHKLHHCIDIPM